MAREFAFYLYSKRVNEKFSFVTEDEAILAALCGLINTLPKLEGGNIQALLKNNADLRNRLTDFESQYDRTFPKVRRILAYVKNLEEDEQFFYIDGTAPLINHFCCIAELLVLVNSEERTKVHDAVLRQYGQLFTSFASYGYGFNGIKECIGDNYQYPCRFCGRDRNHTSFRKEAHAIPDSLGNHLLFSNEECGGCNERLATVEDNLIHFLDVNRAMVGIKTKKGELPEVEGDNFVIRRAENGIGIYAKDDIPAEKVAVKGLRLRHRATITNQGIYKALVKMVIGMLPSEDMPHFSETIGWINGGVTSLNLPSIYWRYSQPVQQPILLFFLNKHQKKNTPYCTCVLYVCNVTFLYIIPFVDIDAGQYKKDEFLVDHWTQFKRTFGEEWEKWNLADDTPAKPFIDFMFAPDTEKGGEIKQASKPDDVFNIHRRPIKRELVSFPEIEPIGFFKSKPTSKRICFNAENQERCHPQPNTELSYNMGCDILINYEAGYCKTRAMLAVYDSPNKVRYLEMRWECTFPFSDISSNIELTDTSFCFDYQLRNLLWQLTLYMGEQEFSYEIDQTNLRGIKISCVYDEQHLYFIRYFREKDGQVTLLAKDSDIHR